MVQYLLLFFSMGMIVHAGPGCTADNCLRVLRATSPISRPAEATSFCSKLTANIVTATTNVPAFAATACSNNVAKLSSACSCLPTPTPTACSSLIQNSDFSHGPVNQPDSIPHWTPHCYNPGYCGYGIVEQFPTGNNNDGTGKEFWFHYQNFINDQGNINHYKSYSLEQAFLRCPGKSYTLTVDYLLRGYIAENRPFTIKLQVGLYGSVPQTTKEKVVGFGPYDFDYYFTQDVTDSGPLTISIPLLSTVPTLGDDGVRITIFYEEKSDLDLYIANVTLLANL